MNVRAARLVRSGRELPGAAALGGLILLAACDGDSGGGGSADPPPDIVTNTVRSSWYRDAASSVDATSRPSNERGAARNVILFVGDGMGLSTITAARILDGQRLGRSGEEHVLSLDELPHAGLVKTYNVDAQVPDSAGTMTAMMSGVKTDAGVLGVDEDVVRGECETVAGNELVSALELAELGGRATGVVTTTRLTHATPAATYAKSADRNWEDDSDMPTEARAAGCADIASQLVAFEARLEARHEGADIDGLEVAFGGGRRHFLPAETAANSPDATSEVEGDRTDGRDLIAEWRALYPEGRYVFDRAGFDALGADTVAPVLGLFAESHMRYEADRANDASGEPSLSEMTGRAIELLSRDEEGYFLVVEGGRIDHAHHIGNARAALDETIAFARAVERAREAVDPTDTLIVVTADHGHVFTIAGYPGRGNPILGKVIETGASEPALAADGLPYTTLSYGNGRGFQDYGLDSVDPDIGYSGDVVVGGRTDLGGVDTESGGFHQEALVPLSVETHSGEDVSILAGGPGAALVEGTSEQSLVFHVIEHAADLVGRADAALAASR